MTVNGNKQRAIIGTDFKLDPDGTYHFDTKQKLQYRDFIENKIREISAELGTTDSRLIRNRLTEEMPNWKQITVFSKEFPEGDPQGVLNVGDVATGKRKLSITSKTKQKARAVSRGNALKIQLVDGIKKYNWKLKPEGFQGHHIRMVKMFSPFYENLTIEEGVELSQWFADEGFPLGDAEVNIRELTGKRHDQIHRWMQEHNIQVLPGADGHSNFFRDGDGNIVRVKGGADISPKIETKARMPYFGHLRLNERYAPALMYLENIQKPVEEKLAQLYWADAGVPHSKSGNWKQFEEIARENKRNARMLRSDTNLGMRARIGGQALKFSKVATGLSSAESALMLGSSVASGNPAGVAAGTLGLLMNTPTFQKKAGQLLLKQGIKFIPGVSLGSGALQAAGYMAGGQWTKAGLSMLGGVVGELGPAGDAVQAAIDLGLTGHDLKMQRANLKNVEVPEVEGSDYMRRLEGAKNPYRNVIEGLGEGAQQARRLL